MALAAVGPPGRGDDLVRAAGHRRLVQRAVVAARLAHDDVGGDRVRAAEERLAAAARDLRGRLLSDLELPAGDALLQLGQGGLGLGPGVRRSRRRGPSQRRARPRSPRGRASRRRASCVDARPSGRRSPRSGRPPRRAGPRPARRAARRRRSAPPGSRRGARARRSPRPRGRRREVGLRVLVDLDQALGEDPDGAVVASPDRFQLALGGEQLVVQLGRARGGLGELRAQLCSRAAASSASAWSSATRAPCEMIRSVIRLGLVRGGVDAAPAAPASRRAGDRDGARRERRRVPRRARIGA